MITADKRKAVFLLHQEGMPIRQISRGLKLSRNAVRRIIAQSGRILWLDRPLDQVIDPNLLCQLYQECDGYAPACRKKLREEHGKFSRAKSAKKRAARIKVSSSAWSWRWQREEASKPAISNQ